MISLIGIALIFALAWSLSTDRWSMRPRVLLAAFALQIVFALVTLRLPQGVVAVQLLASGVEKILGYSRVGILLVFGDLVAGPVKSSIALFVLPVIVFFSALISITYHLGIMQVIVRAFGGLLSRVMGTSRVESFCAAANVMVGQTESPLVIRPYISSVSRPQLFAVMTSGMAGVAGTVLAAYAQLGVRLDYLLAASIMSAPAGLLMAKIVMPESVGASSVDELIKPDEERASSLIMAASDGAQTGLKIAAGVGAMLLAFSGIVALLNGILGALGDALGYPGLSFQVMLGWVFAPVMMLLDLPWREAVIAGGLFGEKIMLNEFVAYIDYTKLQSSLSVHAQVIVTFALCGFANIGSIAIQVAVIGGIDADKRDFVARFGPRALAAASLANLLNAAVAGLVVA